MDDLISRKAAIDAIWDGVNMDIYTREVKEILEALPSVTPQPKMGHWIEHEKGYWSEVNEEGERDGWIPAYECSECGSQGWMDKENYCPNCGAKMEV